MTLAPEDISGAAWDLSKWCRLWDADASYIDWFRSWVDGLDRSEGNRLAAEAAIAEERACPHWDRVVTIGFEHDAEFKDAIGAWRAMIDYVERKGWVVIEKDEKFPSFIAHLGRVGRNAYCWAKVRRMKTRDEMRVEA